MRTKIKKLAAIVALGFVCVSPALATNDPVADATQLPATLTTVYTTAATVAVLTLVTGLTIRIVRKGIAAR